MKTTHLETVSNYHSKLFSRPFLPSSTAKPCRMTCPSQNTSFTTLWLSWPFFIASLFPKSEFLPHLPSLFPKSEFLPHLPSHLQSHPVWPIAVPWNLTQPTSWNPGSLLHDPTAFSLSIHTCHDVSSCFCLQLGISKTWRAGWSHFMLQIWSLFLHCLDIVRAPSMVVEINWN